MDALLFVAVLCRKKTKSAPYRYLAEHRVDWAAGLGTDRFPARSTYFDRYRHAHRLFREAIRLRGHQAVVQGWANPEIVAVDKSLLDGRGPLWHKRDRVKGQVLAGVDSQTTWGYSEHHGWVPGYSYEGVVPATADGVVWPLLASVDTARISESATLADKIPELPGPTPYGDADSAYDGDAYQEAIEEDAHGQPSGRRFLGPENPRNGTGQRPGPAQQRRRRRRALLASRRGRPMYRRRRQTVESFPAWLVRVWELERVWQRGLENNRTQVLAALFAYQVLLRYNHQQGNPNGRGKAIVDRL